MNRHTSPLDELKRYLVWNFVKGRYLHPSDPNATEFMSRLEAMKQNLPDISVADLEAHR